MSFAVNIGLGGETGNSRELIERFWAGVIGVAGKHGTRHAPCQPHGYPWLASMGSIPGISWNYLIGPDSALVEVYIDHRATEKNGALIDALFVHRGDCEKIVGGPLVWECLEENQASRIRYPIGLGGFRSGEDRWAGIQREMVTRMEALESALGPLLQEFSY